MTGSADAPQLSFEEAKALAEWEAKRILQLDASAIRYVKHDPHFFKDY